MNTLTYKNITFNIYGTEIYVAARTVDRLFKKSGVVVHQHYPEYKPNINYDKKGYGHLVVSLNRKSVNFLVHNIIAQIYPDICGEWFEGCVVHHIDHNTRNNDPHNLLVLSRKEHDLLHSESELTSQRMSEGTQRHPSNFKGHKHSEHSKQLNREKHIKNMGASLHPCHTKSISGSVPVN